MNKGFTLPRSYLVIDEDTIVTNTVSNYLKEEGVRDVTVISRGDEGWERLNKAPPEAVVMGWKLQGLSGAALFNRIRASRRLATLPVVVVSGKITQDDFRLIEEFPCTAFVEKPYTRPKLLKTMERVGSEAQWYAHNRGFLERLFSEASAHPDKVKQTLKILVSKSPNPLPIMLLVASELEARGYLKQAADIYRRALKQDDKCLIALNGLGKVLHRLGQYDDAIAMLRVAWRLSSANVQRLCMLGELELSQHDPDAARHFFQKALAVDPEDERAKAGITISNNLEEHIRRHSGAGLPRNLASLCNTLGISMVRANKMEEGMAQYRAALNLLTEEFTQAQVMFNLGLGHLRWGRIEEAIIWFRRAIERARGRLPKAEAYFKKIEGRVLKAASDDMGVTHNKPTGTLPADDEFVTVVEPYDEQKKEPDEDWFAEEAIG